MCYWSREDSLVQTSEASAVKGLRGCTEVWFIIIIKAFGWSSKILFLQGFLKRQKLWMLPQLSFPSLSRSGSCRVASELLCGWVLLNDKDPIFLSVEAIAPSRGQVLGMAFLSVHACRNWRWFMCKIRLLLCLNRNSWSDRAALFYF